MGKTVLQINPVIRQNTSTGRIMREIGEVAKQAGWRSVIAYSGGRDRGEFAFSETLPVGNRFDVATHGLVTRLSDRHGLASRHATRRFIKNIETLNPDIIHIHNIHGYFLNYKLLFDYLSHSERKVVWTIHDCWLYTGHCYHYTAQGCNRWQTGCGHCPQRGKFPQSWFIDRSRRNWLDKQKAFNSPKRENMVLVPVSEWLKGELEKSFLKDRDIRVIHNGIDLSVFYPRVDTEEVLRKYNIPCDGRIILGVAALWHKEKGIDDLIAMSRKLTEDEVIVLVGVDERLMKTLPENIIGIRRTDNVDELAALYSAADVFVNPTYQDNYPTVNLEAIACGTPVVTYRTGGSVEAITPETGRIVEVGDKIGMLDAARELISKGKAAYKESCVKFALANFDKTARYRDYLSLYEELLAG